jgi:hypothetical protein
MWGALGVLHELSLHPDESLMATAPPPGTPAPPAPPTQPRALTEIKIYSHSALFYWWPVWLLGLILGLLTFFGGEKMVVFPGDAETSRKFLVISAPGQAPTPREGVLLKTADEKKKQRHLPPNAEDKDLEKDPQLELHATSRKGYGVLFAIVLLIVIFITNVPLRGMWSLLVIMAIVMLSIIFALAGIWDKILAAIALLDIRINTGGYFFISLGLLFLWIFAFFFFDRQIYMVFSHGAMKVCLEIGAGEKQYDTIGMTIERERSDLFRHWILGLGSGDLIVRTSGADRHEFRLTNVLFINRKLHQIEELQRVRQMGQ